MTMTEDWIVSAAGNVYHCSALGSYEPFEKIAEPKWYFDNLNVEDVTDPDTLRTVAAQLRAIADRLDAKGNYQMGDGS